MDKIGQKADSALNNQAQPGDSVERTADSDINSGMLSVLCTLPNGRPLIRALIGVNDAANDVGVPQQDDQFIDKAADAKANDDIPFGN